MTMTSRKLRGIAVSTLAAAALALAGCASPSTSSATTSSAGAGSGTSGGVTTVTVGITGATAPPTFLPLIAPYLSPGFTFSLDAPLASCLRRRRGIRGSGDHHGFQQGHAGKFAIGVECCRAGKANHRRRR